MGLRAVLASGLHRRSQVSQEAHAMDHTRFDALSRAVSTTPSRRAALTLLAGLGLGRLEQADAEARKSGKCKPTCGECEKCKKGDCDTKNGKKKCKKGKCKPKANGTACATGTCQAGRCVFCADKPDFTDCGGGNQCSGGVCATPPTCRVGGEPSCAECCPGITCDASDHCACAPAGAPCRSSRGCCTGTCVGFSCQ
jgi:hypothetical protein